MTTPPAASVAAEHHGFGNAPRAAVSAAIDAACNRIAPLWPLKHFVAVNPFLGFSGRSFGATCAALKRIADADLLMPREFYRAQVAAGVIMDTDFAQALAATSLPLDIAALKAQLAEPRPRTRPRAVVATVAEVLDGLAEGDRYASLTAFMVDEISKWCAAYFDEGQAAWPMPWRNLPPYAAWRAALRFDRNPEAMGVHGFRATVGALPLDPVATIATIVAELGIPERALTDYLHRALFDLQGWASYARYRVWGNALYGRRDDTLVELLAIRVAWGYGLFKERHDARFAAAWRAAMTNAANLPNHDDDHLDTELVVDLLLQQAYEIAYQRRLLARLVRPGKLARRPTTPVRPAVQAAFCIDVRSEVYRRALESVSSETVTIGFAGFFGFPIEYVPIGNTRGGAQCPVLLTPSVVVCEHVAGASESEETEVLQGRRLRRRANKAWKGFKQSAVSSFTFVETIGLGYAAKIVGDALGLSRPVPDPNRDGLDATVAARVGPRLEQRVVDGRATGFDSRQRVAMAEAALRGMSLTRDFARLVVVTGHRSTTVNNPHASGFDCGACGGHTGEANARVAAAILNDADVRAGLAARGIVIPADTCFLGALHDTTTDEVHLYDADEVPPSWRNELEQLRRWMRLASSRARAERARHLRLRTDRAVDRSVIARSRDWSQVRPEWGLAGNAAFVAAPRERTRGIDFAGRCFLHDYDWRQDEGFGVLELIMTAPLVVASWINLQYYGSTVNNGLFGSGNKTLHNVVGGFGVLEGNAGPLKAGLPLQSVHDGERFVHEPLRLNVFIAAPEEAIDRVIAKHERVRELVDNGWVHLFRITDDDASFGRFLGAHRWETVRAEIGPGGEDARDG